jgi:hypothetical protein
MRIACNPFARTDHAVRAPKAEGTLERKTAVVTKLADAAAS